MENIKEELKSIILDVILPESEAYLKELNEAEDDIDAKNDMEAFIGELKTILGSIEENKISDEDAKNVYEKITLMLNEHEE